jgi:hypothetical protein
MMLKGVRYVLIDVATVRGDRPAGYWSRGQATQFYSTLAVEEAVVPDTGAPGPESQVDRENEELAQEVAERERERERKTRRRFSGGGHIP